MTYTDEQIAVVVHEANCGLQIIFNDPAPAPHWLAADEEMRSSAIEGVRKARRGITPKALHEEWVIWKKAHGWIYGERKNPEERTHPCILPYEELPATQQVKNRIFLTIVETMAAA